MCVCPGSQARIWSRPATHSPKGAAQQSPGQRPGWMGKRIFLFRPQALKGRDSCAIRRSPLQGSTRERPPHPGRWPIGVSLIVQPVPTWVPSRLWERPGGAAEFGPRREPWVPSEAPLPLPPPPPGGGGGRKGGRGRSPQGFRPGPQSSAPIGAGATCITNHRDRTLGGSSGTSSINCLFVLSARQGYTHNSK